MSENAYEAAISTPSLTDEERRNLELTKAWSEAYGDLDNIEHFCNLYAEQLDLPGANQMLKHVALRSFVV